MPCSKWCYYQNQILEIVKTKSLEFDYPKGEENENQTSGLVCPTHKTEYLGMLVLGVFLGGGAVFAYLMQTPMVGSASYKIGFADARKLVEESPMGAIYKMPDDVRSISGVVTKVSGSSVTVLTTTNNPFDDKALLERTVLLTKETQVTKISHGGEEKFRAQMDAFMKDIQSGKVSKLLPPTPPEPTRTKVALSGVAVGATVSATAVENIRDKKEFTASAIEIF